MCINGLLLSQAGGILRVQRLDARKQCILIAFSFLFTLNIAISNVSLLVQYLHETLSELIVQRMLTLTCQRSMVSIPVHQVVRATTPLLTIVLYRVLFCAYLLDDDIFVVDTHCSRCWNSHLWR